MKKKKADNRNFFRQYFYMKKIIYIFSIALACHSTSFAKEADRYEIRTAPIAFIARWATLDFSFALNKNWAIGPSAIIYASPKIGSMLNPSYSGSAFGGHLYGYLNSFSQSGWYWGNHLYYENYESYPHDLGGHYELSGTKFNTKLGYQIVSKSKFIFLFGAGAELRSYSQVDINDSLAANTSFKNQSGVFAFIEAKIGYKF